ncbi:MAG: threonine synthase, partial [Acidimicrobiia bacterium]
MFVESLRCRECARTYQVAPIHVCQWCYGPLEVEYDYPAIAATISRERIAEGPPTLWRYQDLLPVERAPS